MLFRILPPQKKHGATFLRPIFLFPSNPSNKKTPKIPRMSSLSDVNLGFIGIGFFAKNPKKKSKKINKKNKKIQIPNPLEIWGPETSQSETLVLRLGLCRHFGIHPTQMAFAYDPDGASVCRERLLPCFAFRFFQQPGCFFGKEKAPSF